MGKFNDMPTIIEQPIDDPNPWELRGWLQDAGINVPLDDMRKWSPFMCRAARGWVEHYRLKVRLTMPPFLWKYAGRPPKLVD